ncbi:MAG TPA: hypothetical protein VGD27_17210 [Longimicrobiales bacterium]
MKRFLLLAVFVLGSAGSAAAQADAFANAEVILQRTGIALSGGNPLPGASSTLGIRLGALPKVSVAARLTGARLVIPDEETTDPSDELSSIARSLNVDASVGIFSGFSVLPTVGGFGSIDLLASYGKLSLADGDGFTDDPSSWGAGVRIGILRESFTAPGIAISGMYRSMGDLNHVVGQPELDAGTIMQLENNRALNLRATVGKRILMLGAVAGVGYDRFYSDATYVQPFAPNITEELETSATTLFGSLSWTMLILHIVGEGGVQRADGESAVYGSLALRLSL